METRLLHGYFGGFFHSNWKICLWGGGGVAGGACQVTLTHARWDWNKHWKQTLRGEYPHPSQMEGQTSQMPDGECIWVGSQGVGPDVWVGMGPVWRKDRWEQGQDQGWESLSGTPSILSGTHPYLVPHPPYMVPHPPIWHPIPFLVPHPSLSLH